MGLTATQFIQYHEFEGRNCHDTSYFLGSKTAEMSTFSIYDTIILCCQRIIAERNVAVTTEWYSMKYMCFNRKTF